MLGVKFLQQKEKKNKKETKEEEEVEEGLHTTAASDAQGLTQTNGWLLYDSFMHIAIVMHELQVQAGQTHGDCIWLHIYCWSTHYTNPWVRV